MLYDVVVNSARTELLAAAIDRGLRNNKVSWARLYRDIAQKIGRRFEVDAEIVHRLGVQLPEAKAAVDAMRGASDDEHEVAARCREFLDSYERKRGNRVLVLPFAAEVSDADSD